MKKQEATAACTAIMPNNTLTGTSVKVIRAFFIKNISNYINLIFFKEIPGITHAAFYDRAVEIPMG
ncbi:hypothetical protein QBE55_01220 [Eubacteriales bacterium mix99]|jgi:hypothetical protein